MDFKLFHRKEVIVCRCVEVNDCRIFCFGLTIGLFHSDGDSVFYKIVLLFVYLQEGCRGQAMLHHTLGLVNLSGTYPWIKAQQSLPKMPGQQDSLIACPPKAAILA